MRAPETPLLSPIPKPPSQLLLALPFRVPRLCWPHSDAALGTAVEWGTPPAVAIASALLFFILSQKSESEEQNERDNFYRDFDSVYRYIDDTSRDLRDEIRTCSSNSEKCCSKKSVR